MTAPAAGDQSQAEYDLAGDRSQLVAEGDAAAQARDYDRAMERYLLATFYDLLGEHRPVYGDLGQQMGYAFDQRFAFAQPHVLRRIAVCANALGMDLVVVQLRFMDLASLETRALADLHPPLSPEEAWARIEERLRTWLAIEVGLRGTSRTSKSPESR